VCKKAYACLLVTLKCNALAWHAAPGSNDGAPGIGGQQIVVARLFWLPYSIAELAHISLQIQAQIQKCPSEIQTHLSIPL